MSNPVIMLTTPFNPGDLDPGHIYPMLIIHEFRAQFRNDRYILDLDYLDETGQVGKVQPKNVIIQDAPRQDPPGTDYTDLRAKLSKAIVSGPVTLTAGEGVAEVEGPWTAAARVLYEFLIANGFPGVLTLVG